MKFSNSVILPAVIGIVFFTCVQDSHALPSVPVMPAQVTAVPTETPLADTCKNKVENELPVRGQCEGTCEKGACTDCFGVRTICKYKPLEGGCVKVPEEFPGGGCKCDKDVMGLCPPPPADPKKCYVSVKDKNGHDKYPFCSARRFPEVGCHGSDMYDCKSDTVKCNDGAGGGWDDSFPCPTPTPKPKRTLIGGGTPEPMY